MAAVNQDQTQEAPYTARFSILKICLAEACATFLVITMIYPGNTDGLSYTKFLFAPDAVLFRIFIIISLSFSIIINFPNLYRAIMGRHSLYIDGNIIRYIGLFDRSVEWNDVKRIKTVYGWSLYIVKNDGKRIGIPVGLMNNSKEIEGKIFAHLSPVI